MPSFQKLHAKHRTQKWFSLEQTSTSSSGRGGVEGPTIFAKCQNKKTSGVAVKCAFPFRLSTVSFLSGNEASDVVQSEDLASHQRTTFDDSRRHFVSRRNTHRPGPFLVARPLPPCR